MAIAEKEPLPTFFGESFVSVDEADASAADFQAPKKENRWLLVELPKDQLEALEAGELFHIKAHSMGSSGNAALTTKANTWSLEFLENSNPMFLGTVTEVAKEAGKIDKEVSETENKDPNQAVDISAADKPPTAAASKQCTIFAQCRGHIFLKPLSSDVQRVRDLLAPHNIDGSAQSSSDSSQPMTTSHLEFQVAASPKELQSILEQGPYVERDGVWCWLPAAFEREVTDASLNLISLNNWSLASVDVEALLQAVQRHFGEDGAKYVSSKDVLFNALRGVVREPAAEPAKDAAPAAAAGAAEKPGGEAVATPPVLEEGKIALDEAKIKLFQATQLLRESPARLRQRFDLPPPASRPKRARTSAGAAGRDAAFSIEEFAAAFSALTGSDCSIEDLCKIVGDCMYIDEMEGSVHTLDVTTLPQDSRERLKRLFELSSHWKPDRLASLLAPTVRVGKVDVWLMKYCRVVFVELEKDKEIKMMTKKFEGVN